jgi:hypothetical protein
MKNEFNENLGNQLLEKFIKRMEEEEYGYDILV